MTNIEFIKDVGLDPRIDEFYADIVDRQIHWVIVWGTSKCVLEIFDGGAPGMCPSSVELYSILFTPLMVYHNVAEEVDKERPGRVFRSMVLNPNEGEPNQVSPKERFGICVKLFRDCVDLARAEGPERMAARRKQLGAVLSLYGACIRDEELLKQYEHVLADESLWRWSEETDMDWII